MKPSVEMKKALVVLLFGLVLAIPATGGVGNWTTNGPKSGPRVSSIAVSPRAPATIYATASSGGEYRLFQSFDGGESWTERGEGLPHNAFLPRVVVDPHGASVYVVADSVGLFKSVDGGAHFTASNSGLSESDARAIQTFAIDPRNTLTLYQGAGGRGLFKSLDGGSSWARTPIPDFALYGLAIDPLDTNVLYATGYGHAADSSLIVMLKSVDGGLSWAASDTGLPDELVESPRIDPVDPHVLYCIELNTDRLYKSVDGGAHWTATGASLAGQRLFSLEIDPHQPSHLYATSWGGGLFKSVDAGMNWTPANTGLTGTYLSLLAFDPSAPATLFTGGLVGISKSTDAGASWRKLPLDLPAWILSLAADPAGTVLYAGTFSGVFRSVDGGGQWVVRSSRFPAVNAIVEALAVDPSDPRKAYAAISGSGVFRTSDGGESWTSGGSGLNSGDFTALVIDPKNPSTLYCGTYLNGVFKSEDGGKSWTASSSGLSSSYVGALTIDPVEPARLYAGSSGGIFRSLDSGASWTLATAEISDVTAIAVDPSDPSMVYAAGPWGALFRSLDRGAAWERAGQLEYYDIYCIGVSTGSTLYVGTNAGIFRSGDAGVTWKLFWPISLAQGPTFSLAISATGTVFHSGGFGVWDYVEPCETSGASLCLLGARFRVSLQATDPRTGRTASGRAIPEGDRFGSFSLPDFTGDPSFPEVFVKMLDATSLPGGHFWLFHTGLTDLQYTLTVRDLVTGSVRQYRNDRSDPTALCGGADTSAFLRSSPGRESTGAAAAGARVACVPGSEGLCLLSGRFRATVSAEDRRTGRVASGRAIPKGERFGYFSLPDFTGDASFPEVFVKMLDATSLDGHFWLFHTGLTDLAYTLTVTDLASGEVRVYQNHTGDPTRLCGGADTAAFGN